MKAFFAISFLIALLWQPFYQAGYIGYWQVNRDKIAKTECINRFKPMMHCNGKCQLYRQLKKAAEEEAENNKLPIAVLKIKDLDTFIEMETQWQWITFPVAITYNDFYTTTKPVLNGHLTALLRPPQKLA